MRVTQIICDVHAYRSQSSQGLLHLLFRAGRESIQNGVGGALASPETGFS